MTDTSKKTIVVFSGDMDKVLAAFVMANGAAAMGDDVTMFFTFWGLNALRRPENVATTGKLAIQKMFGRLMPRGAAKLPLSKMNFAGMGPRLMKRVMRERNIMSLEELIASAREQEVTLQACTMAMDVMGLTPAELIDGVDYVGVATYLAEAEKASLNLFI